MREHIRILGILNIILGSLTAFVGIVVLIFAGGMAGVVAAAINNSDAAGNGAIAAPIIASVGVAIAVFLLILALPSILGGWGLLKFKPWARILMIVVSVFHLLHIPIGTILGVYGLWVLFSDETRRLLESGGVASALPASGYPSGAHPAPAYIPPAYPPGAYSPSAGPVPQPPAVPPRQPPPVL